ncbi:MAG: hypothetical protein KAW17_07815 [Candidatus Eisenbacteria sp.]|nr:hypothetical protein [Candidatus Eisenbacteria bacterium]
MGTKGNAARATQLRDAPAEARAAGICSTCNHARGCMHMRENRGPVWHCEEHESYTELDITDSHLSLHRFDENIAVEDEDSAIYAGLCRNCKHRATCTLSRPEDGVWWCEEYE